MSSSKCQLTTKYHSVSKSVSTTIWLDKYTEYIEISVDG